jgi:branched-subunit amino acid aminotransferase/4-amino-4-deoxychorismate lyase
MRLPEGTGTGWIDGRRVPREQLVIPLDDPAFHVSLAVFETIAVRSRGLLDLEEHLERLAAGARVLSVPLPECDRVREWALKAAAEEEAEYGWLKIVATRGGRCFVFTGDMDPAEEGRPRTAILLPWRRNPADPLSGLKTTSYAATELGLEHARSREADEGLWLNTRGHLTEGCTSNLFVIQRKKLFTAAVRDGILPGITRGLALDAARRLGLVVHEGKLRLPRLRQADEAFLTSSVRGVCPLVRFDRRAVGNGRPGPITREITEVVAGLRPRSTRDG